MVLFSRSLLFLFFQAVIAWAVGSWSGSVRFWMLTATLMNIVSIIMLMLLLKGEGTSYTALFRTSWDQWKRHAFLFMGLAVLSIVLALLPNALLNNWIHGNDGHYQELLFQPVPNGLRLILLFAFPITTGRRYSSVSLVFYRRSDHLRDRTARGALTLGPLPGS
ncbi:MAG: hypothetical protein K8H89_08860 [Flavobacteriales bacterium]|nr:hypothetical protein [Flavobacteriales bacterium]